MVVVNFTIELEDNQEVLDFENYLKGWVEVKDFQIIPDTKQLYEKDSHFKLLTKKYYDAKKVRNDYINEHNYDN